MDKTKIVQTLIIATAMIISSYMLSHAKFQHEVGGKHQERKEYWGKSEYFSPIEIRTN